ncbi:MAG: hypothetical protein BMS9Abin34_364 [Patescibacteria group bacterium]|nr:MAG: hypothetical protein BMS9Abin34_364 [Patescibacteria group bacterium]
MRLWIFDLDGTLVSSGIDYDRALMHFVLLMLDVLEHRAPRSGGILWLVNKIDKDRFKEMRADKRRFPGSLVECYRQLCSRAEIPIDHGVEQQCWDLGYSALSEGTYRDRSMILGAAEALQFLLDQGLLIFCVTAGDPEVQWMKWRGYNLRRFFPTPCEFRVVRWDKEDTLRRLLKENPGATGCMVGDSIGSDLCPAYKVGLTPVYVPNPGTWDHGELVEGFPPGTVRLEQISEITALWGRFSRLG